MFGLDKGLSENDAALIVSELSNRKVATGKPDFIGDINYHQLCLLGYGYEMVDAFEVACVFGEIDLRKGAIAIQRFGGVGKAIANP